MKNQKRAIPSGIGRKWIIAASLLFLFVATGYLFLRFHLLKARSFEPDLSKAKSPLDLRPALIAKLQQLVKDGSDGLYKLSVESLDPDISSSTLDARNVVLTIDTLACSKLDREKKLPDDMFRVSFRSLHVTGIGIMDLLKGDKIRIAGLEIGDPVIENIHKKQAYNREERKINRHLSIYQRLTKQIKSIEIGHINISNGSFTSFAGLKYHPEKRFENISIRMDSLLIDSSTQYDKQRFLFAKKAMLKSSGYSLATSDSVYLFKIGALSVSADEHTITANDVELKPRQGRQQFEKGLKYRDELLHFSFPRIVLTGVDWWALLQGEEFKAEKTETFDGDFSVYLDKSLPDSPSVEIHNFPSQLLMDMDVPISLKKVLLHNQRIVYEEFNPDSHQSGIISFDKMEAHGERITNIPAEYRSYPVSGMSGSGFFMKSVPISCEFRFDLAKVKSGVFALDVHMGALDHSVVNTFSEPMALLSLPSGQMQQASVHITGNNSGVRGTIDCRYTDLHLRLLKEKNEQTKKKTLSNLIANAFLIKNNNPGHNGTLRQPDFEAVRDHRDNFFSLVWIGIKTGLLETAGIPVKLGIKEKH